VDSARAIVTAAITRPVRPHMFRVAHTNARKYSALVSHLFPPRLDETRHYSENSSDHERRTCRSHNVSPYQLTQDSRDSDQDPVNRSPGHRKDRHNRNRYYLV